MKSLLLQIIIGLNIHVSDNMEVTGKTTSIHIEDGFSYALVQYDFDTTLHAVYALAVEETDAAKIVHYGVILKKRAALDYFTLEDKKYLKRRNYISYLKGRQPCQ